MVADAVKHVVHTLIMLWLLRRQLGGLAGNPVMRSAVKSLAAAMVTGAAAFAVAQLISELGPAFSRSYLLPVLAGGVAGLLAYTVSVFAFNIKETRALPGLLRRRNTSENSGE